jgi:hypothetical protein
MRQPFLVVSPWAKKNFVDHTVTDQTSVLRFIEDNWLGGQRIGQGSFDAIASSITQMFKFDGGYESDDEDNGILVLDPASGEPQKKSNRLVARPRNLWPFVDASPQQGRNRRPTVLNYNARGSLNPVGVGPSSLSPWLATSS